MAFKRKFNNAARHLNDASNKRVPQAALNRLFKAVTLNDVKEINATLAQYPDALKGKLHGKTPLQVAVEKNQFQSMQALLKAKADPNAMSDDNKSSPLLAAVAADNTLLLINLLHAGAELNVRHGWEKTPLTTAVENESLKALYILVRHGASLQHLDDEGNTAFHTAIVTRKFKAAKALLDEGMDIDKRNRDLMTPLMQAAQDNNLAGAKFLLENGADYELRSDLHETARDIARAFPGKDDKFLKGFELIMADRLRLETRKYLPDFKKGTQQKITVKRPARFGPK